MKLASPCGTRFISAALNFFSLALMSTPGHPDNVYARSKWLQNGEVHRTEEKPLSTLRYDF